MKDCALTAVADVGVLIRFDEVIGDSAEQQVRAAERAVRQADIAGLTETIPSYTALYVGYDATRTTFERVSRQLRELTVLPDERAAPSKVWQVPVCYEGPFAPDLEALARQSGMTTETVIDTHLSGDYSVSMYGFAPGYAYLRGVPPALQQPRKPRPVPDVPAGSVMVTGAQCLVSTLNMPSGWWVIGASPFAFLARTGQQPFPVEVGDQIRFTRIDADELMQLRASPTR